ncbi:MAG TPA: hypothetical protein VH302_11290 [Bryobacteraceae bacterium]|nr:hypothetical protein [Bryobacteraceae bacterium]
MVAGVRSVKFCNTTADRPIVASDEFQLKKPVIQLIAYARKVEMGMIHVLEVRGGLPVFMEIAGEPVVPSF